VFKQWELKLEIAKPRMQEALGSVYEAEEAVRRSSATSAGPIR
jgi:hypothetical protein